MPPSMGQGPGALAHPSNARNLCYQKRKQSEENCTVHQKLFGYEAAYHPIFPCISCHRDLYPRAVEEVTESFMGFLRANKLIHCVSQDLKLDGKSYICKTCKKYFPVLFCENPNPEAIFFVYVI